MSIRSPEAYAAAAWDWKIFDGCFEGRIRPSDIDGIVSREGHFLIMECKPPNKEIGTGQRLTFQRLSRVPGFTILIMWGRNNEPSEYALMGELAHLRGVSMASSAPCDLSFCQAVVREWWQTCR